MKLSNSINHLIKRNFPSESQSHLVSVLFTITHKQTTVSLLDVLDNPRIVLYNKIYCMLEYPVSDGLLFP